MSHIRRAIGIVPALAVAAVSTLPAQRAERYELTGSHVAIYNLAGAAAVEGGSGSAVVVEVTRGGADAGALQVEVGSIRDREALRVLYPADRIVYRPAGTRGRMNTTLWVRDDGTFGDGEGHWRRGDRGRVEIRSYGDGMEAHANLRIIVPAGQQISIYLGAGEATVRNVDGQLRVDAHSGRVETTGTRGSLHIDTGSGNVTVTNAEGDVDVDTGSGGVEVTNTRGSVLQIDTGSGGVRASRVSATTIDIDTGSGSISLSDATATTVRLDTGSGGVDAVLSGAVEDVEVDTGSGSVTLSLPASFGARVELDTGSGGIDLDFPLTVRRFERDHVTGVIGDGRGRLTVDTGSGSITIRRS